MIEQTIVIRKVDKLWTAFNGEKKIGASRCRPCVVLAMQNVTKESIKYKSIIIVADNGEVLKEIPTGAANDRNS